MANIAVGTGSGSLVINVASNKGDTIIALKGKYTSLSITNEPGVTIDLTGCEFNGSANFSGINGSTIKGGLSNAFTGTGVVWNGTFQDVNFLNWTFQDVNGLCNDASGKVMYDGTDATWKFLRVKVDGCKAIRSGQFLQGSYGWAATNDTYMNHVTISNTYSEDSLGNGTEVIGVIFNIDLHDWVSKFTKFKALNGDVGLIQFNGSGTVHHVTRHGGVGYIARWWVACLVADKPSSGYQQNYFYNILDTDTSDYGMIDVRIDQTLWNAYVTGGDFHVAYVTGMNKGNTINYWSSDVVKGDYPSPWVIDYANLLGINLVTNGKPPLVMNNGGAGNTTPLTSVYFASGSGVLDSAWTPINSQLIGKGTSVSWVTDDVNHVSRNGSNDIGAVQSKTVIVIIPPTANAGNNQSITLPTNSVTLNGAGTGTGITFAWSQISGPNSSVISSPSSAATGVSGLIQGTYQYQLKVTDNIGQSAVSTVTVTVAPQPNISPVSNAGADQTIVTPVNATILDGSASVDPDGSIASYAWSLTSGDATLWITNPTSAKTAVINLKKGSYQFSLKVTDNKGATGVSSVSINVVDPAPIPAVPVATFSAGGVTYTVYSDGSVLTTSGLKK